jgi:hypothetical protein
VMRVCCTTTLGKPLVSYESDCLRRVLEDQSFSGYAGCGSLHLTAF